MEHLDVARAAPGRASDAPAPGPGGEGRRSLRERVEAFERAAVHEAVVRHGGNRSAIATELGMHRSNLHRLGRRLGLRSGSSRRRRADG